jgi:atypical dual specificity phosphatase
VLAEPALLCVDEATSELDTRWSERIIDYLRSQAKNRAILFITHNRQHAQKLGGCTALIAGGRLIENAPTEKFYDAPSEALSKTFVRFGSCAAPSPNAKPSELTTEGRRLLQNYTRPAGRYKGPQPPSAFRWLINGQIAGTSRPGLFGDLDDDLRRLCALGINRIVTLEERVFIEPKTISKYGLRAELFPIPDLRAPTCNAAIELCVDLSRWLRADNSIAFHSRAGRGRTGTMLAAYLIYTGQSALEALERVRRINPAWVESDEQVRFLKCFAEAICARKRVS